MGRGQAQARTEVGVRTDRITDAFTVYAQLRQLRAELAADHTPATATQSAAMNGSLDLALTLDDFDGRSGTADPDSLAILLLAIATDWIRLGAPAERQRALEICIGALAPVPLGTRLRERSVNSAASDLIATGRYAVCERDGCLWSIESTAANGMITWECLHRLAVV